MDTHGTKRALVVNALRVALVAALFGVGVVVYRHLPQVESAEGARSSQPTVLRIVLRAEGLDAGAFAETKVELFSFDVAAARREFDDERRYGQRFEDFVARRMGSRQQPVSAKLDREGETVVSVPPGRWWIHATLAGADELSWRLPVNVAGREQTVELTPSNAYTRTKSF